MLGSSDSTPIAFDAGIYSRDAVDEAARTFAGRARIDITDAGADVIAHIDPESNQEDVRTLRDEFCTAVFLATAEGLRRAVRKTPEESAARLPPAGTTPPWPLLAPYRKDTPIALGWVVDSLSDVRDGAATLTLRHERHGIARVSVLRNGGAPVGVAYTPDLDFLLMNGGEGAARTEESLGRALFSLARTLAARCRPDALSLAALIPHSDLADHRSAGAADPGTSVQASRRIAPTVDPISATVSFEIDDSGANRLALYEAVLGLTDICSIFVTRRDPSHIRVHLRLRADHSPDALKHLVRDATIAINHAVRGAPAAGRSAVGADVVPAALTPPAVDALLAELDAADAATLGLGFRAERGPEHEHLRVLTIRGSGACNSECVFCVEKFSPVHRGMPTVDAIRERILQSAGQYDMLFFASGEPTIHPKIFEHVELARRLGFISFGMSSHFRTFSDPRFALKTLQAGFEYFDISLHAADAADQLAVNPIDDGGRSLDEALKGLAVLYRLAEALQIPISISHKIVVSRLNATRLADIFRATYDRGVRNFILQPVRTDDLAPELQAKLAMPESEMLPYVNAFLEQTASLDVVVKPYGFSRVHLYRADHVEHEQNRVKNVYGARPSAPSPVRRVAVVSDEPVTDGRHWIELKLWHDVARFASTDGVVLLDQGLQRGLDLPFGCRMGSCGMCAARLVKGCVDQRTQIFLNDEQIEQGYVLLCQAYPQSDLVLEMCSDREIDQL